MKKLASLLLFIVLIGAGVMVLRSATNTKLGMQGGSYVALGDSVAAGLGLSSGQQTDACGRSNNAYSQVVAGSTGQKVTNLSCSGATMNSGLLQPQASAGEHSSQLEQLFAGPLPATVSVTIGANDLQWTKLLAQCYQATCGSEQDSKAAAAKLATLGDNLDNMLAQIKSHYAQQTPRVVLTGYYQVLPADKTGCPKIDELTSPEIAWWHMQENNLNTTIKSAAQRSGVGVFAPVDFSGHDICKLKGNSWVQSLGSDAPFHPTETGQQVIAGAVITALGQTK